MQPYFMPYIGYFQLINAVDKFVLLDDVNYINRGWINRNNILVNGKSNLFVVPLQDASQNKHINEIEIVDESKWKTKLLKTIELSYKKAPYFSSVYSIIDGIINSSHSNISDFNYFALVSICNYVGIETEIVPSSSAYKNAHLKAQDKIIDICLAENASVYINPIGGTELYDKNAFIGKKIELFFIKSGQVQYLQFVNEFVPWLSMIDVMMFNNVERIKGFLNLFQLI